MNDYKSKNLDKDELARLTTVGKTFMTLSGAVMRNKKVHPNLPSHAPFMLFPTPFPEYLYTEATDVQKDFQILFRRASDDPEFIKDALKR
jgi:Eukaryotic glutathione synthase, ATP binding domain.